MVAILGFSKDHVTDAVQAMYGEVAASPTQSFHFPVGRTGAAGAGYPEAELEDVPRGALASFVGVGYPFRAGVIRPGHTVLDIGAGSGTDTLLASALVGEHGKVWALDLTLGMLARLRRTVAAGEIANVEVVQADAERLPLADASVDVVTSNGALNLIPDKRRTFAEIFRVLRPDGRVQIADVVISRAVPLGGRSDPELWAECVVGAAIDEDYLALLREAGFSDVEVLGERDYFANSPSATTRRIASSLGARAMEITMRRPARHTAPSLLRRIARRLDPRRWKRIGHRGLWGAVAAAMALVACYGVLGLLALLSVLGMTMEIPAGAWAAAVAGVATIAVVATGLNLRRHRKPWPLLVCALGAAMIVHTMLGTYDPRVEALGFAVLIGAVGLDLYTLYRAELCP